MRNRMRVSCATCGAETERRAVSAVESVSARYCQECAALARTIEGAVDAGPWSEQAIFQLAVVGRLRRMETVAHDIATRRLQAAHRMGAAWDDLCDAVGLASPDELWRMYPLRDSPDDNWGWGQQQ